MKYLCDNPECPRHCLIEWRSFAPGGPVGWHFHSGNRGSVEKEFLAEFDPDAVTNLCARCKGAYRMGRHDERAAVPDFTQVQEVPA